MKNKKIVTLSSEDSESLNKIIPKLYQDNNKKAVLDYICLFFDNRNKLKEIMPYDDYKIFNLATNNLDFNTVEWLLKEEHFSSKQVDTKKFLIVSNKNYALLDILVNKLATTILTNTYNKDLAIKFFKIFTDIKPNVLSDEFNNRISKLENGNNKLGKILSNDYKLVLEQLDIANPIKRSGAYVDLISVVREGSSSRSKFPS